MKPDAISIVEAAYECEGDRRSWFRRILEVAGPSLNRGFGVAISTYVPNMRPEELSIETTMTEEVAGAMMATTAADPENLSRTFSPTAPSQPPHGTASSRLGMTVAEAASFALYVRYLHPHGIRDIVGVTASDITGHVLFLAAPAPDLRRPSRREVATWSRIAAHLSAGARLRRAFPGASDGDVSEGADAVLSPSGAVSHATVAAQSSSARESLRRAAKAIDRARSKARSNEDEALDLWQALVAGRWSLFDRFDSDGRRFLVARKNDPQVADPRALTLRERQVLAYAAMGHAPKLIAYSLGVSPSSISAARGTAMRKLGLQTTADVVRLFARAQAPLSEPSHER